MKKVKIKTIMANEKMSAKIGDIINVDDAFAADLLKAGACELIQEEEKEIVVKKTKKKTAK